MPLKCEICNSGVARWEIQPHIIACELRSHGYKPQVSTHRPHRIWLVDVFSPTAFLLGVRKEGSHLYSIDYSPSDYPIQFDNLNDAIGHMWWRLDQFGCNP